MELLPNGLTLHIPAGCFPLCTDSILLAHFVGSLGSKTVLDLGSGCGTIGLMLCAANPRCRVAGVELDAAAHRGAEENIRRNQLEGRMQSICTDLRQIDRHFQPGSFDCCVSNPPYFAGGPQSAAGSARREDCCTLAELIHTAAGAVKYGGDFFLVHRPERLGEIIALGAQHQLEAKQLTLVRHREGREVSLILLRLRRGGKPGLTITDWVLHDQMGQPTKLYRQIYHMQEE